MIKLLRPLPVLVALCVALLPTGSPALAQSTASSPRAAAPDRPSPVAQRLVREALNENLSLRQEQIALRQRRTALQQTRGQYFPSLDLKARYSRATGGRTINFPAGDLVNPAYRALEDLTQNRRFPTVQNQEIQFLRSKEQRTTLQFRQPIFQPDLYYGTDARRHEVSAQQASVEARRRELARDVTVAYYRYRKAQARVDILEASRRLVREHRRTNERLLDAAKVTKDAVHRAEAEVLAVQQKLDAARTSVAQARRQLNVLRNRPADVPIPEPTVATETLIERRVTALEQRLGRSLGASPALASTSTGSASGQSATTGPAAPSDTIGGLVEGRPELRRLDAAAQAAEAQRRAAQTEFLPTVSLGVDAGVQGKTYGFSGDKPFARASVVLEWNLFDGLSDRRRVQRRRLETKRLRTRRQHVAQRLSLKVREALDAVREAHQSLETADARVTAAQESFRLTRRRYDVGRANQATLLDARTALTEAKLSRTVTRYDLLIHLAELTHAAGLAPSGTRK